MSKNVSIFLETQSIVFMVLKGFVTLRTEREVDLWSLSHRYRVWA